MNQPVAFLNGEFCPSSQLTVPVDDLGFLQGVAVSERMRTFRGQLFRLDDHLDRLENSLEIIDVRPGYSRDQLSQIAQELIDRNRDLLGENDDFGLSLYVTPGTPMARRPTVGIQCYPLPFGQWATYYTRGQALTEAGVRQVPATCWPLALKCRSRMHYYLADKAADRIDPGSRAVLLDQNGFVSEASTANIVMYREDRGIVSPPLHHILPGVSLTVLKELATSLQLPMVFEDFDMQDLAAADEILLCSTSPCVWPVTRLNGVATQGGVDGRVFRMLLSAWGEYVGLDIAAQAQKFAHRC
jgi:branched-subunit amino acid aminotransferase/4-amino-4-deoxychorismate lyase